MKSPQTNGICERFHRTVLEEFYQVTSRKKIYESLEELQTDLDQWLRPTTKSARIKARSAAVERLYKLSLTA